MALLVVLQTTRGLRVHVFCTAVSFLVYCFALVFLIFEKTTFMMYAGSTCVSVILLFVFGQLELYSGYRRESKDRFEDVGCSTVTLPTDKGGNRVLVFFPAKVESERRYCDMKWALDKKGLVEGLYRFFYGYFPRTLFKFLTEVDMGVFKDATLHPVSKNEKYPVFVFSHGVGQTANFFSTMFKCLASQGFVVCSIEHRDYSSLHFQAEQGSLRLFKDTEMRDYEAIDLKLALRQKELSCLVDNLDYICSQIYGYYPGMLDIPLEGQTQRKRPTILAMGHGLGGVSAIQLRS